MDVFIRPRKFSGNIAVPASKSHTIRRLLIASLAEGESILENPLDSLDARSCLEVCAMLGARITEEKNGPRSVWRVRGFGGAGGIKKQARALDVGNSGTTLFLAIACAALSEEKITFTGDKQIEKRSAQPLLEALSALGVEITSNSGCAPLSVRGPIKNGRVSLPCQTSQYLSALLLAAPLSPKKTVIEIDVPLLNEKPYIEMTLSYLDRQGAVYEHSADFSHFKIEGGLSYRPVNGSISGDFSSAAFPALAAVVSGGEVRLSNLDPDDSQGDKAFFSMLGDMGCAVRWDESEELVVSRRSTLKAASFDLNSTPDLLPACAVLGAFAEGTTSLYNAAHARIKETDRIAVMAEELSRAGARCTEMTDGLKIERPAALPAEAPVFDGRGDHRVVMALAAAALALPSGAKILGAEAADVTYPGFIDMLS